MAQREYEDQPEAADLGEVVQEDTADTLVGPPASDVLDAGFVPPDRPYVADDEAVLTRNESLDQRLRAERPDPATEPDREVDRAGRLEAAEPGDATAASDSGISGGASSAEEAAMHVRGEDDVLDGERRP